MHMGGLLTLLTPGTPENPILSADEVQKEQEFQSKLGCQTVSRSLCSPDPSLLSPENSAQVLMILHVPVTFLSSPGRSSVSVGI